MERSTTEAAPKREAKEQSYGRRRTYGIHSSWLTITDKLSCVPTAGVSIFTPKTRRVNINARKRKRKV